jgi:lipoprotein-anchoring transpeptidase ErfK/SrfK|tara:strand:+ start:1169 stop:1831 length:663 start_codon:yes stop_codon:yes gene_type:complete
MKVTYVLPLLISATVGLFLASCGSDPTTFQPNPDQKVIETATKVINPYPQGSYEYFKYDSYPGTTRTWKNHQLIAAANSSNTNLKINLATQRGFLLVNDDIAMDYRISTGRSTHKTPTGNFSITEKLKDKRSNLYGKIFDSNGDVVKIEADTRIDIVPPGGEFLGASMSYWMRLTKTGIGMHQGKVSHRYASHGCIRTHSAAVSVVFAKTQIGTPVTVTD